MKAVLLAGGKGTRLRPFTHVFPKPLMPLGEDDPMPIIEVVLRQLARFGFRDVTIITGYLTELIEAFCGDGRKFGTRLHYRREDDAAGDGRRPDAARASRRAGPGHQRRHPDHTRTTATMYAFHRDRGAAATIASYPREVKIDFGVLEFGDDPHVLTGYREKPEYSFQVSMGVYILDPLAWDYLDPGRPLPMPDLLEAMRSAGTPSIASASPATGWTSAGTTTMRRPTRSSRPGERRSWEVPTRRSSRSGATSELGRESVDSTRAGGALPATWSGRFPLATWFTTGSRGSTSAPLAPATSAPPTWAATSASATSFSSSLSTCSRASCRRSACHWHCKARASRSRLIFRCSLPWRRFWGTTSRSTSASRGARAWPPVSALCWLSIRSPAAPRQLASSPSSC